MPVPAPKHTLFVCVDVVSERASDQTNERIYTVFGVCNGINFVIIKSIYVNDKWKRLWILETAATSAAAHHRQSFASKCASSMPW